MTTPEFEQMLSSNRGRIRAIANQYDTNGEADDLYQKILEQLWRRQDMASILGITTNNIQV